MNAIGRYVLLTFRIFVRQSSIRSVLLSGLFFLPALFLYYFTGRPGIAASSLDPLVLCWIAVCGYVCGGLLRGRSATPGHTPGVVGFSLPISPRARWMGGLVASGVLGLALLGTLHAIGLTLRATWSFESFVLPMGLAMLTYLPWAGFAFLGREDAVPTVLLGVMCAGLLWMVALVRLEPDALVQSLWSGLLLVGAFLIAPRLEYVRASQGRGSLRDALVRTGEKWPRMSALGAPPLSPFLAWERVLMRPLIQLAVPLALVVVSMNVMFAFWGMDPGDSVQAELLESSSTVVAMAIFASVGVPMAVPPSFSLAPAALLPLSARSLWWGTFVGALPLAILMIAACLVSGVVAASLAAEPLDPTLYQAFLANSPISVAFVLLLRASWHLGFLLTKPQRALSIVCAFLAYVGSFASWLHPSWIVSSIALAVSIGVLALLAPRRYRAPA